MMTSRSHFLSRFGGFHRGIVTCRVLDAIRAIGLADAEPVRVLVAVRARVAKISRSKDIVRAFDEDPDAALCFIEELVARERAKRAHRGGL